MFERVRVLSSICPWVQLVLTITESSPKVRRQGTEYGVVMGQGWHMGEETAEQPSVIDPPVAARQCRRDWCSRGSTTAAAAALRHLRRTGHLRSRRVLREVPRRDRARPASWPSVAVEQHRVRSTPRPARGAVHRGQSSGSPDLLDSLTAARSCGAATLAVMKSGLRAGGRRRVRHRRARRTRTCGR